MNNSMVAHLWAHEQEESASGSNFFFEGTSIYSYGHHFEVGRIVKNKLEDNSNEKIIKSKIYSKMCMRGGHYQI